MLGFEPEPPEQPAAIAPHKRPRNTKVSRRAVFTRRRLALAGINPGEARAQRRTSERAPLDAEIRLARGKHVGAVRCDSARIGYRLQRPRPCVCPSRANAGGDRHDVAGTGCAIGNHRRSVDAASVADAAACYPYDATALSPWSAPRTGCNPISRRHRRTFSDRYADVARILDARRQLGSSTAAHRYNLLLALYRQTRRRQRQWDVVRRWSERAV